MNNQFKLRTFMIMNKRWAKRLIKKNYKLVSNDMTPKSSLRMEIIRCGTMPWVSSFELSIMDALLDFLPEFQKADKTHSFVNYGSNAKTKQRII